MVLLCIYLFLSSIYQSFTIKFYSYIGFYYFKSSFNETISLVLLFFSLGLLFILPMKASVFATSVIIKIWFLIPTLILFSKMNTDVRILFSMVLFDFLFVMSSFFSFRIYTPKIKTNHQVGLLMLIAILLLIPIIITFGTSLNFNLLLLKDIYKYRIIARLEANALASYAMFWTTKVVFPIMLVYGMIIKNKKLVLFSILSMLFIFLVAGAHKAILFSIVIIIYFYFVKSFYKKIFWFSLGILALSVFGILVFSGKHTYILADLLIRRSFLELSLLDTFYFKLFDHNHVYLSHSILKGLVTNPFPLPPTFMVGKIYFHSALTNAGNGIISDGFMNFGMPGVIISILIAVVILNFCLSANLSHQFFGIIFIIIYGFSSAGILTNILNGGVFLIIILIQVILKDLNLDEFANEKF
jgi:hypothetical protein